MPLSLLLFVDPGALPPDFENRLRGGTVEVLARLDDRGKVAGSRPRAMAGSCFTPMSMNPCLGAQALPPRPHGSRGFSGPDGPAFPHRLGICLPRRRSVLASASPHGRLLHGSAGGLPADSIAPCTLPARMSVGFATNPHAGSTASGKVSWRTAVRTGLVRPHRS